MNLNLKSAPTPLLLSLGDTLVNPAKRRGLLEGAPELVGHLPALGRVQEALSRALVLEEKLAPHAALAQVAAEARVVDSNHDRAVRQLDRGLEFAAAMAPDGEVYWALKRRLLPTGATIINKSYRDEAAEAAQVAQRVSAADEALLRGIRTPEGSLADAHRARLDLAARLDQLEDRRVELEAQLKNLPGSPQEVIEARNTWIRVVRQVLVAIEEDPSLSPVNRDILLTPFREEAPVQKRPVAPAPAPEPPA